MDEKPNLSHSEATYVVSSDNSNQNATYIVSPSGSFESSTHSPIIEIAFKSDDDSKTPDKCGVEDIPLHSSGNGSAVAHDYGNGKLRSEDNSKQTVRCEQQAFVSSSEFKEASPAAISYAESSEGNTISSICNSVKRVVRVSSCKSPSIQKHIARIMGCRASRIPKLKSSANIQASPQVMESCTQSLAKQLQNTSIQTFSATKATTAQTNPSLDKVDQADASTGFPETVCPTPRSDINTPVSASRFISNGNNKSSNIASGSSKSKEKCEVTLKSGDHHKNMHIHKNKRTCSACYNSLQAQQEKQIANHRLDFQATAKSKIGSMVNASHKPLGGDKKVYQTKLTFRETACSRIDSLENIGHKPGGGTRKIKYQVVAKRSSDLLETVTNLQNSNILSSYKVQRGKQDNSVSSENSISKSTTWATCTVMTEPIRREPPCSKSSRRQKSACHSKSSVQTTSCRT